MMINFLKLTGGNRGQFGGITPCLQGSCGKAEWIAAAAMAAGSIASSLFGGAKAKREARRAETERRKRANIEHAWYDKQYNTDYLDTAAGNNLMRRAQEVQDRAVRRAEGTAAVGGATDAAVAQAKESANKSIADTIASIASSDTARKQSVADTHMSNQMQQSRESEQAHVVNANNISNATQAMSNTLMSSATTQAGSDLEGRKSLKTNPLTATDGILDNTKVSTISSKTMLDDAVQDILKRKPNIPRV